MCVCVFEVWVGGFFLMGDCYEKARGGMEKTPGFRS